MDVSGGEAGEYIFVFPPHTYNRENKRKLKQMSHKVMKLCT